MTLISIPKKSNLLNSQQLFKSQSDGMLNANLKNVKAKHIGHGAQSLPFVD